ncbi:MAG: hypothetical protein M3Q58_01135, partial [Bacteroidota bacterium]|nr:hypothetical protein [Bacteroidota bacterium]
MDINNIKSKLLSDTFEEPNEAIDELLKEERINDDLFEFILKLEDELVISDFLVFYKNFTTYQLERINLFVKENLFHESDVFRSDLIDIANYWRFKNIYNDCLIIIRNHKESDIVILSSLSYIFENSSIKDIPLFVSEFKKILNNP